jgi:hypothetical protein
MDFLSYYSLKLGTDEVLFASLDDLIEMKKAAGRPQDLQDLKYLRKIKEERK